MNLLFYKMRTGKKGQIIAVLTVALVIFVISAFLVVNLGKRGIQDTRMRNAAQAGVLAGGSAASVLLNSMANVNDTMILNFVGFTYTVQFLLVGWIIDYVKVIIAAASTLILWNWSAGPQTILALATLCITTATLALMISASTNIGKTLLKLMRELNDSLPKNSRDSARQYAFSNAGVDAPRISFSKSGAATVWDYSLIETEFDIFMRELPATNKADLNYGTSTLGFDWVDSRGEVTNEITVTNQVAVTVTTLNPWLRLGDGNEDDVIKFSDVFGNRAAINNYLSTQDLGVLGPLILFGVNISGLIKAMIWATWVLILALAVVLAVIAAAEYALAAVWWAVCGGCAFCFCCCCFPACGIAAYYTSAAGWMTAAAIVAGVAGAAFAVVTIITPPGDIPCFVWDKRRNEYPLSVTVAKTTNPESIDYGIYRTHWPVQSSTASGIVKDGAIFPPRQMFDIITTF